MELAKWKKGYQEWTEDGVVHLSVVFTWDAAEAYQRALFWANMGHEVKVGGPGIFTMRKMFMDVAEVGTDYDEAVTLHNATATFASRGCNVGCWFCIVPAMEGREFTLIPEFVPRPILCDNNLSALEPEYQDHIIERYQAFDVPLLDANSGFEPMTFDEEVYRRWKPVNKGAWRFAYDETGEGEDVERVAKMLAAEPSSKKRVYVLIGNEPVEDCMARISRVIDWGCEPHVQPLMKLNAPVKKPHGSSSTGRGRS